MTSSARFPLNGAIADPRASDYRLEAALLGVRAQFRSGTLVGAEAFELHEVYAQLARRKAWSEQLSRRRAEAS